MQPAVPSDVHVAGLEKAFAIAVEDGHLEVARLEVGFDEEKVVQTVAVGSEGRRDEKLVGFHDRFFRLRIRFGSFV